MEYILGAVITVAIYLINKKIYRHRPQNEKLNIPTYSQSQLFSLIKPLLNFNNIFNKIDTQATRHIAKQHVRVILADHKAYWIMDNVFYEADEIDGFIDKESAKPVDTIHMDKVQLDKMIAIVETLTERNSDEDWNSR